VSTNITNLRFDDDAGAGDISVVLTDGHELVATKLDMQELGLMIETLDFTPGRLFFPWSLVSTIKQAV